MVGWSRRARNAACERWSSSSRGFELFTQLCDGALDKGGRVCSMIRSAQGAGFGAAKRKEGGDAG